MRLERGVDVAGMDPGVARELTKACHGGAHYPTSTVARWAKVPVGDAEVLLGQLADAGFLDRRTRTSWDGSEVVEWATTVRGGALANASFLKPMTRAKASTLLAGVLERAGEYNADPGKLMWIDRIVVFGSYLDAAAALLGDLDLQVALTNRPSDDLVESKRAYARASGRTFPTLIDELFWAEREARQILKNRSGFISIHTEDISAFTDRFQTVYERPSDV